MDRLPEPFPFTELSDNQIYDRHAELSVAVMLPHTEARRRAVTREMFHLMWEMEMRELPVQRAPEPPKPKSRRLSR